MMYDIGNFNRFVVIMNEFSISSQESLKSYSNSVLSITADNGSGFAYHEKISNELNAGFYFAHPYSSWARGLNENTNGLVRQYLRKGSSFTEIIDQEKVWGMLLRMKFLSVKNF